MQIQVERVLSFALESVRYHEVIADAQYRSRVPDTGIGLRSLGSRGLQVCAAEPEFDIVLLGWILALADHDNRVVGKRGLIPRQNRRAVSRGAVVCQPQLPVGEEGDAHLIELAVAEE